MAAPGASNGCIERSIVMPRRSPHLSCARRAGPACPGRHRCRVAAAVVLASLAATGAARGEVLLQRQIPLTFRYDVQPSRPINGPFEFTWALFPTDNSATPPLGNQPGRVFEALRFTPATVGQTFRLLPGDDPDFAGLEATLTNGREDRVWQTVNYYDTGARIPEEILLGGEMGACQEQALIYDRLFGQPYDLAGNDITALGVRHDSLSFETRGTVTYVNAAVTLTIEGAPLPEPGGALLGLSGAAWVLRRRR
jgi:hypothetical protein